MNSSELPIREFRPYDGRPGQAHSGDRHGPSTKDRTSQLHRVGRVARVEEHDLVPRHILRERPQRHLPRVRPHWPEGTILQGDSLFRNPREYIANRAQSTPRGGRDPEDIFQALNRYWTVDEPAVVQLIRSCRRVREETRAAEEIAFFVREKTELARHNRNSTNPTGLILAVVSQSFVGSTFGEFRSRMERQNGLATEEMERKDREQAQTITWLAAERNRYEAIVSADRKTQDERDIDPKKL